MKKIILASQSPRRKQLLEKLGFHPFIHSMEISENIDENLNIIEGIKTLALAKAKAAIRTLNSPDLESYVLITADTIVYFNNKILGKPKSREDAFTTLKSLSGNFHQVFTAFCLYDSENDHFVLDYDQTDVQFRLIKEDEIWQYIDTGEPMDKAGSYGIQGLGGNFVENYKGSWTNVVGLPTEKLMIHLNEII